jgi:hypothetical protein
MQHPSTYRERAARLFPGASDEMIERVVSRLEHGDVSLTRYGARVALRPDLGDDRAKAKAYWPERERGCLCYSSKARGLCSHTIAAAVLRDGGYETDACPYL